ncbi:MAG: general secretion pathway protein GspK [Kiritimatiellae bacterium]|nr:general secretion pathway protein GspK [Kiritimatiellia bacterium]MCB1101752.1 general secretion pathway protein GspK [Kiritimatiellia bacterium]
MPAHHSELRSLHKRIRLTGTVLSLLLLVLAGFFFLVSLLQRDLRIQDRFQHLALGYLGGAAFLFVLRLIFVTLPHQLRRRARVRETRSNRREGASLILVLGLLALLSALLYQAHAMRAASELQRRTRETALRLQTALIDAGRDAIQRLARDDDYTYDSRNEPWTEAVEWTDPDGIGVRVRIVDANRRFDLNNLAVQTTGTQRPPDEILLNLLVQCGEFSSGDRVKALKDWVDQDEEGFRESPHYQDGIHPRKPSNRPLLSWSELFAVDGWTRDLFLPKRASGTTRLFEADLVECATLIPLPRDRVIPINLNTANRAVLLGLIGLEYETAVDRILTFRDEAEIRTLDQLEGLVPEGALTPIRPYLDIKSTWFQIDASGFVDGISSRMRWLVERDAEGTLRVHDAML